MEYTTKAEILKGIIEIVKLLREIRTQNAEIIVHLKNIYKEME